ncbi:MAG TPA: GTPase Era [Thermodesulfovibrionales bacterium]|nr:GTPase Era [Thermodesulfovibrionales bacterium]
MPPDSPRNDFRSGFVAITGRPNVGKSTLLNTLLGEKISIVTSRPQTTRKRITGVRTSESSQIVFIDTPGIHKPHHALGEFMVKEAREALKDVDLVLFMVEPRRPGLADTRIISLLRETMSGRPILLLINKVDTTKKAEILPLIEEYRHLYPFDAIVPLSALNSGDVTLLLKEIEQRLPHGPKYYPDDVLTDQLERSLVSEIIREKAMEATEEEVPHAVAVEILQWKEREDGMLLLDANIYVEREGQKGIIIGRGGKRLKEIGSAARADIETLLGRKVFMKLWVKVREDWRSNKRILKEMGFE